MRLNKNHIKRLEQLICSNGFDKATHIVALQEAVAHWREVKGNPKTTSIGFENCSCCLTTVNCMECSLFHSITSGGRLSCCGGRYIDFVYPYRTMHKANLVLVFIEAVLEWIETHTED